MAANYRVENSNDVDIDIVQNAAHAAPANQTNISISAGGRAPDKLARMNKAVTFAAVILVARLMFPSWSAEAKVRDYLARTPPESSPPAPPSNQRRIIAVYACFSLSPFFRFCRASFASLARKSIVTATHFCWQTKRAPSRRATIRAPCGRLMFSSKTTLSSTIYM